MNLIRHRVAFAYLLAIVFCSYSLPRANAEEKAPVPEVSAADAKSARSEAADVGYTKEAATLYSTVKELNGLAHEAQKLGADVAGIVNQRLTDLEEAAAFYSKLHGTCVSTQSTASKLCREKTSPQLQGSLNQINTLMGMAGGMVVKDACSNFAKAMKMAQAGLTLYTAACSAARAACEGACTTVKSNLDRILKVTTEDYRCFHPAIPPTPVPGSPPDVVEAYDKYKAAVAACTALETAVNTKFPKFILSVAQRDAAKEDRKSTALKYTACTYEYGQMIMSAGMGILSVANSIKQGQECDKQTDGTGEKPEDKKEKCDDPANASLPECICRANPRTPGCSNAYQKPGESSAAQLSASNLSDRGPSAERGGPNLIGGLPPGEMAEAKAGGEGAAGGVGAPSGGGGSGLGGSGGGFGKGAGKEEAAKKGLDANILGSGGGGGGGGWGSAGSGGSADRYRAYLPGGAKDPNKGLAGQQSWRNEVTGQGGKSNWEKVKDRYRDNKNTLLNN
jgi:hypothetical protein